MLIRCALPNLQLHVLTNVKDIPVEEHFEKFLETTNSLQVRIIAGPRCRGDENSSKFARGGGT